MTLVSACIAALLFPFLANPTSASPQKLATAADYHRYIDPLLQVNNLGTDYFEDGAADATVIFPSGDLPRAPPVAELVHLGTKSLPLLIDCLSDGRLTKIQFEGNAITRKMNVPIGYVCLDILMNVVPGKPASEPDCADDGLGACMNYRFYFRPDDYEACTAADCLPRPWVLIVKGTWRNAYLAHHLKFQNPYDRQPAR
jgi:hypothetical protein